MPLSPRFRSHASLSPSPLTRSTLALMAIAGAVGAAVIVLEPPPAAGPPSAVAAAPVPAPEPAGDGIPTIVIIGKRERPATAPVR